MSVLSQQNNRRIARNTLLLYFRMLILMIVALYTSRIVLEALGVEDYGVYNVVGGVVGMMGILNNAMSVSTQRYLTYEFGKGNNVRLKQVFSTSLFIYFCFAIILLLLAETVGLWFLNTQLVISPDRMEAANWVYQFSVFSVIVTLFYSPYNAVIITHENMSVYAYLSIIEAVLRLCAAYILLLGTSDLLILYGFMLMIVSFISTFCYIVFCIKHYPEARFKFYNEKKLFVELMSYSGWNMFGSVSGLVKDHGVNILLNLFFNPSVNAARGLVFQVNTAVSQFFGNFYTAVRPQITKYYAQGDLENMFKLVFRSSKMSFFLILLVSLPLFVETPYIIQLWLGQNPAYVVEFVRLVLLVTAVDAMASPLMTSAHATGKIKLYQSLVGTITMLNLPISYIILKLGGTPQSVFYVSLLISIVNLFMRLWLVRKLIPIPVMKYISDVLGRCVLCASLAVIIPIMVLSFLDNGFGSFCLMTILCFLCSSLAIWPVGLNSDERKLIVLIIKNKIYK